MMYITTINPNMITNKAKNLYLIAPGVITGKLRLTPIVASTLKPHVAQPVNITANTFPIEANKDPLVILLLNR